MGSSHRLRTALHVVEIIAIVAVMAITGLRLVQKTMPMTRADTMTLGVVSEGIRPRTHTKGQLVLRMY